MNFGSVCQMMDLSGTINALSDSTRAELRELRLLTLSLEANFSDTQELYCENHETVGVLYNFDITAHGTTLEPKLHVPVKHYASNDLSAAQGLGTYLPARGRDRFFSNYMRALERTCTHRSLSEGRDFHTYVGTGIGKDGSLSLCSYINGEVYHPARYHAWEEVP